MMDEVLRTGNVVVELWRLVCFDVSILTSHRLISSCRTSWFARANPRLIRRAEHEAH